MPTHRPSLTLKPAARHLCMLAVVGLMAGSGLAAFKTPPASCAAPGCLDDAFGAGGVVQYDLYPSHSEFSKAVAVQPDGRLVSVGFVSLTAEVQAMTVARFLSNGSLDASFDGDGVAQPEFTIAADVEDGTAVAIAPDLGGNLADFDIVVTGDVRLAAAHGKNAAMYACTVARFNSDGSLETGFGTGGKLILAFSTGTSAQCNAIAVDGSSTSSFGRLVLAGQSDAVAAIARLNGDGTFDTTFGSGGRVLTTDTDGAGAYSVRVDVNGRVVISTRSRVLRRQWNGAADTTFGSTGSVSTGLTNGGFGGLVIDSLGRIIVIGEYTKTVQTSIKPPRSTTTTDVAVVALLNNGQRDTTFGTGGLATIDLSPSTSGYENAVDVDLDAAGRIVLTAFTDEITKFRVVRLAPNGALDFSFGTGGIASVTLDSETCRAQGLVVTPDGIVVAGAAGTGSARTTMVRFVQ